MICRVLTIQFLPSTVSSLRGYTGSLMVEHLDAVLSMQAESHRHQWGIAGRNIGKLQNLRWTLNRCSIAASGIHSLDSIEGNVEVKFPTIWTDEKQRGEESEKRRKKIKKEKSLRRKMIPVREKIGKSRSTVFFQWFVAPGGSKSRLARAAGAEPSGRMRDQSCTPLRRKAYFQVKMYKTLQCRTTFGSCNAEKVHAIVARSTFPSENARNITRRCGAKHVSESKVQETGGFEALLAIRCRFLRGVCTPGQEWAKSAGFVAGSTPTTTPHHTTRHDATHYATLITLDCTTTTPTVIHSTSLH